MQYERQPNQATVEDDPQARAMLRQAFDNTARWQADFKGFTADLTVNINGKEVRGSVTVRGPQDVSVDLPDSDVKQWAEQQIKMIAVHRGPRTFDQSDGKYALTLEDDHHPFGAKIFMNGDPMQSFYRVKGDRITQINRKAPQMAFTINVEDSAVTQEGKFLTTRYTVYYFSPKDRSLTNVESFTDSHVRVAASDLPASRRIVSYENGEVVVRMLTFQHHKML